MRYYSVDINRSVDSVAYCLNMLNNEVDMWDWRISINAGGIDYGVYFNFDIEKKELEICNQPFYGMETTDLDEVIEAINEYYEELNGKLGEVLLTPTKIYVKPVLQLLESVDVHAICHITGGGFDENIPRVLTDEQGITVNEKAWEKPPIFAFLEKVGKVPHREMFNVFNMGIGMVAVVDAADAQQTIDILNQNGEKAFVIGEVTNKPGVNIITNE